MAGDREVVRGRGEDEVEETKGDWGTRKGLNTEPRRADTAAGQCLNQCYYTHRKM